jgi:hypothetical protein
VIVLPLAVWSSRKPEVRPAASCTLVNVGGMTVTFSMVLRKESLEFKLYNTSFYVVCHENLKHVCLITHIDMKEQA